MPKHTPTNDAKKKLTAMELMEIIGDMLPYVVIRYAARIPSPISG